MARLDLDGATAVVTGGSRGIGPHIAAALTEHGVRVALIARSRRELEAVARDMRHAGHHAIAVAADVTSHEERRAIVETVERELGPIDVLVNNAGGDPQRRFHNLAEDDIEAVLSLNLTGAVVLSRLVLPGMIARGRGARRFRTPRPTRPPRTS
jgi:NADP-dependent 3-hydroxy acid dehydrogenase YdfG